MPPQCQPHVVRAVDEVLAAAKGAVAAGCDPAVWSQEVSRVTKHMYIMETPEVFKPGTHPEYYKMPLLDGQDRCRYTWETVVAANEKVSENDVRVFSMQKLISPGSSFIFEDAIFSSMTPPHLYLIGSRTCSLTQFCVATRKTNMENQYRCQNSRQGCHEPKSQEPRCRL